MICCLLIYQTYHELWVTYNFLVLVWIWLHDCLSYDPCLGLVKLILYHVNFVTAPTHWPSQPAHQVLGASPARQRESSQQRTKPLVRMCPGCHLLLANPCACSTSSLPNRGRFSGQQLPLPLDSLGGISPSTLCACGYLSHPPQSFARAPPSLKLTLYTSPFAQCPLRPPLVRVFESASRPLVDFGVLNGNLIKGLILCVKCICMF
jgi:hypothetical protein